MHGPHKDTRTNLCVCHLVKNPDFSVNGGSGYPVAIVMEEDPLFFGVASQRRAQFLHFVHRGVQTLLVASLKRRGDGSLRCILRRETVKQLGDASVLRTNMDARFFF